MDKCRPFYMEKHWESTSKTLCESRRWIGSGYYSKNGYLACPIGGLAYALPSSAGVFVAFIRGEFPVITRLIACLCLFALSPWSLAETTTVKVKVDLVDSRRSLIAVSYDGKSRQLDLAKNVAVEVDGKRTESRALIPGDDAVVTYDKDRQVVTKISVRRPGMLPAEKLADGWEDMDQRLVFLVSRLADVEASLDAIEQVIGNKDRQANLKTRDSKLADRANEDMDRKGGGPIKWSEFYGTTAEKFFYHPTDRNSSYHTVTVLSQQGPQADNKVGGGVPSSQGLPVHQRPPQFDYIYRANEKARERAISEASELRGKIDQLNARRKKLEGEQAGLWVDIAFRSVAHYDLDKKPVYRYEPLLMASDTDSRNNVAMMKATSSFMAVALSIVDDVQKDQRSTFTRIKPAIAEARQTLDNVPLNLGVDVSDKRTSIGKFFVLAKRLEDTAANLTESYLVAIEGDAAKDQFRKDSFRLQLQQSLIGYAQIVLAMDEMTMELKDQYAYKPDTGKPIRISAAWLPRGIYVYHKLWEQPHLSVVYFGYRTRSSRVSG